MMSQIGQFNLLPVASKTARGLFLNAGHGQVFLPASQAPKQASIGQKIRVFLYQDQNNEVIATTRHPLIELGKVSLLRVASVSKNGAFLDWGLPKDLFLPFAEQVGRVNEGDCVLAYCYLDNTGRLAASMRLHKYVPQDKHQLKKGDKVKILVADESDLGTKVIVNRTCWGLIHRSDIFKPLEYGKQMDAVVKQVRSDKRLDIILPGAGTTETHTLEEKILDHMHRNDGISLFNDKSDPQAIYEAFGVSKKVFKATLGKLFKQKKILIENQLVRLPD